jgi:hypothetical protein
MMEQIDRSVFTALVGDSLIDYAEQVMMFLHQLVDKELVLFWGLKVVVLGFETETGKGRFWVYLGCVGHLGAG